MRSQAVHSVVMAGSVASDLSLYGNFRRSTESVFVHSAMADLSVLLSVWSMTDVGILPQIPEHDGTVRVSLADLVS